MAASLLPTQIDRIAAELDSAGLNRIVPLLAEWREAATQVQSSLQQCIQILGHAAPSAPAGAAVPPLIDLQATLKSAFLTHLAHRPDLLVSCTMHFPDRLPVHGDSAVWQQVVGHLVDNSLLHGFAGRDQGAIQITGTLLPGQRVLLHYYDDGQGMGQQIHRQLRENGFSLGQGQRKNGLAVVHDLVQHRMGGRLELHRPAKGFHLSLEATC
ncbi:MAG: ATP-binding protein [Rhodoferax sp.]|nr:ATP-binding protein [Rhodoferax sp.]